MTASTNFHRLAVLMVALAAAPLAPAQDVEPKLFSRAQLEQMAAPVALYPDALLMQILMAATYPLEVIQAHRFLEANLQLSGPALEEALQYRDWDPSVKSLCQFPGILKRMNDNLDWTKDLGDAFLGQQADLLDAVQRLRTAAYEAGNLQPCTEQDVLVKNNRMIVIEPRSPEVVYVPIYYPVAVYGPSWGFSRWYYPALFLPPPHGTRGLVTFSAKFVVGRSLWSICTWGWGRHAVDIDIVRYREFNRRTCFRPDRYVVWKDARDRGPWQHFPKHRHGVNYRDPRVARRFLGPTGPARVPRDEARGFPRPPQAAGPGPKVREPAPGPGQPGVGHDELPPRQKTARAKDAVVPRQGTPAGTSPAARASAGAPPVARAPAGTSPGVGRSTPPSGSGQPAVRGAGSAGGSASRSTVASPAARTSSGTYSGASRGTAFSGSRQPALDRAASARGSASRSTGTAPSSATVPRSGSSAISGAAARSSTGQGQRK